MIFNELEEFKKDMKSLARRFPSVLDDLKTIKSVLSVSPHGEGTNSVVQVSGLKLNSKIFKSKLMCRSLKKGKKLRLIYCYAAELDTITFIQLYFKGDTENEDRKRILANFK